VLELLLELAFCQKVKRGKKHKKHPKSFDLGCFSWCARRDLNSRLLEYMVFLELLITQISRFASNIPIFPTEFFTLILLRVPVRVKIRVISIKAQNTQAGANRLGVLR